MVDAQGYPDFDFDLTTARTPVKVVDDRVSRLGHFSQDRCFELAGDIAMNHSQQSEETSLSFEDVALSGLLKVGVEGVHDFSRTINGMRIKADGSYQEAIRAGNQQDGRPKGFGFVTMSTDGMQIAAGGEFRSLTDGSGNRANSQIVSHFSNVVNRGDFEQLIDAGDGADTVVQLVQGFRDLGTPGWKRDSEGVLIFILLLPMTFMSDQRTPCHAR